MQNTVVHVYYLHQNGLPICEVPQKSLPVPVNISALPKWLLQIQHAFRHDLELQQSLSPLEENPFSLLSAYEIPLLAAHSMPLKLHNPIWEKFLILKNDCNHPNNHDMIEIKKSEYKLFMYFLLNAKYIAYLLSIIQNHSICFFSNTNL